MEAVMACWELEQSLQTLTGTFQLSHKSLFGSSMLVSVLYKLLPSLFVKRYMMKVEEKYN